jgi:hypothetical protein
MIDKILAFIATWLTRLLNHRPGDLAHEATLDPVEVMKEAVRSGLADLNEVVRSRLEALLDWKTWIPRPRWPTRHTAETRAAGRLDDFLDRWLGPSTVSLTGFTYGLNPELILSEGSSAERPSRRRDRTPAADQEFTFASIYRQVHPPSPEWLARRLSKELTFRGGSRVFRVASPSSTFTQDFPTLDVIPSSLVDPNTQQTFVIDPALITVILKGKSSTT